MRPLVLCVGERRTSAWANGFLSNEDNHNPEDPGRLPCTSGIAPPPPPRRRILLALSSRGAGRRGRSVCWLWGLWLGGRQGTHGRRLAPWASLRAQGNRSVSRCAAVVSRDHEPRRRPPRPPLAVSAWDRAPAQVNRRPTPSWCCEPRPLPPPPAPGPCGGAQKQPGGTGRGRGTRRAGSSGQRG